MSFRVNTTETFKIDTGTGLNITNGTYLGWNNTKFMTNVGTAGLWCNNKYLDQVRYIATGTNGALATGTVNGGFVSFGDNAGDPTMAANTAGVYAKDVSGTVELFAIDDAGNATQLSPHDANGEWVYNSRNTKTGKRVLIQMERLVAKLAERFPEDFADLVIIEE